MYVRRISSAHNLAVVALVGSAGSLHGIQSILHGLDPQMPAAVLVLMHQDPARSGEMLTGILERSCAIPVSTAIDGNALWAGEVLVAPPGQHLMVTPDCRVATFASGEFPPNRPSADLLLSTLATAVGRRAIAVVLSGHGHDAATGATAVHHMGGTVLASDEATSEVFAMPSATINRGQTVDYVLPLPGIPAKLHDLLHTRDTRPRLA